LIPNRLPVTFEGVLSRVRNMLGAGGTWFGASRFD
jgi:hypothetical protein